MICQLAYWTSIPQLWQYLAAVGAPSFRTTPQQLLKSVSELSGEPEALAHSHAHGLTAANRVWGNWRTAITRLLLCIWIMGLSERAQRPPAPQALATGQDAYPLVDIRMPGSLFGRGMLSLKNDATGPGQSVGTTLPEALTGHVGRGLGWRVGSVRELGEPGKLSTVPLQRPRSGLSFLLKSLWWRKVGIKITRRLRLRHGELH